MKTGISKNRFDGWGWNRFCISLALKRIPREATKRVHSARIFAELIIPILMPYSFVVSGHSNCVPPVRPSPMRGCKMRAAKYGVALFL